MLILENPSSIRPEISMDSENKKTRVLLDLDGVIRDFIKSVESVYKREYPDHVIKEVVSRELHNFFPIGEGINEFIKDKFGEEILLNAPAYPGAVDALRKWQDKFEIVIVTAQPDDWRYSTYSWIGNHRLPVNEVKITYAKHTVDGFALLDDFQENLELFTHTGRLAVCMDQPWNQEWKGERVNTVDEFFELVHERIYKQIE